VVRPEATIEVVHVGGAVEDRDPPPALGDLLA
jgi:hypothetical protein